MNEIMRERALELAVDLAKAPGVEYDGVAEIVADATEFYYFLTGQTETADKLNGRDLAEVKALREAPYVRDRYGDVNRREPDGTYTMWLADFQKWGEVGYFSAHDVLENYAPVVAVDNPEPLWTGDGSTEPPAHVKKVRGKGLSITERCPLSGWWNTTFSGGITDPLPADGRGWPWGDRSFYGPYTEARG